MRGLPPRKPENPTFPFCNTVSPFNIQRIIFSIFLSDPSSNIFALSCSLAVSEYSPPGNRWPRTPSQVQRRVENLFTDPYIVLIDETLTLETRRALLSNLLVREASQLRIRYEGKSILPASGSTVCSIRANQLIPAARTCDGILILRSNVEAQ